MNRFGGALSSDVIGNLLREFYAGHEAYLSETCYRKIQRIEEKLPSPPEDKPQQEQPNTTDHGMVAGNTATLAAGLLSQCRFDLKDHNRQIVVECIAFREGDGLLIKQIHNFLSTSAPV